MKHCVVTGVDLLFCCLRLASLPFLVTNLIYKTLEKGPIIRNRLQTTYNRQKSYADHRRRDIEFEEGDKMYLNISPMKGVVRLA